MNSFKLQILAVLFSQSSSSMFAQDSPLKKASDTWCDCITQVVSNDTEPGEKITQYKDCLTDLVQDPNSGIKQPEDIFKIVEVSSPECQKTLMLFYTMLNQPNTDSINALQPLSGMNCQKLITGNSFQNANIPGYTLTFQKKYVLENSTSPMFNLKSHLTWTGPCTYFLTLKESNSSLVLTDVSHDTTYVDILRFEGRNMDLRVKNKWGATISNYRQIE